MKTIAKRMQILFRRFRDKLTESFLFLFYSVFKQELIVLSLSEPVIVLKDHPFTISWRVSGCYRVIINDSIILPGDTTKIYLDSTKTGKSLNITFYGVHKAFKKTFPIHPLAADLKTKLEPCFHSGNFHMLPVCKALRQSQVKEFRSTIFLQSRLTRLIAMQAFFTGQTIDLQPEALMLDSFNIEHYKPKSPQYEKRLLRNT